MRHPDTIPSICAFSVLGYVTVCLILLIIKVGRERRPYCDEVTPCGGHIVGNISLIWLDGATGVVHV